MWDMVFNFIFVAGRVARRSLCSRDGTAYQGAEAPVRCGAEKVKAEALAYLEATARTTATAKAKAKYGDLSTARLTMRL
jgi:hypothetical protein